MTAQEFKTALQSILQTTKVLGAYEQAEGVDTPSEVRMMADELRSKRDNLLDELFAAYVAARGGK